MKKHNGAKKELEKLLKVDSSVHMKEVLQKQIDIHCRMENYEEQLRLFNEHVNNCYIFLLQFSGSGSVASFRIEQDLDEATEEFLHWN